MTRNIVIIASTEVQALDVIGPSSVFVAASEIAGGDPAYAVGAYSPTGGAVETVSGVPIVSKPITEVDPCACDTLLVAGHRPEGTRLLARNNMLKDWALTATGHARRWGSICTGAFVLASWGVLDGKRVTTHWMGVEELKSRYPETSVDPESLYVVDGHIWTSAGVTAGIDMSLAMVEADLGVAVAAAVAKRLVVYLRRPGSQSQFSDALEHQYAAASPYGHLVDWVNQNLDKDLTVDALAEKSCQSVRTFQRRFTETVGRSPAAFVEDLRIERAKALISANVSLKSVAKEVGYLSASRLTSAFRRRLGVSPSVWKAMHGTIREEAIGVR